MFRKTIQTGLAISLTLASMLIAPAADATTLGQKRCQMLDRQLSDVMRTIRPAPAKSISAMAEKARSLCDRGKPSQGLRLYARALRTMGHQPVLPSDTQPKPTKG